MSESISFRNIKQLNLKALNFTNLGIMRFLGSNNAKNLQELRINWNKNINDEVLKWIGELTNIRLNKLEKVFINETNVTHIGIDLI